MKLASTVLIVTLVLLAGCGGGSQSSLPEPRRISVSPQSVVAMEQGATQQFSASVSGISSTGVSWSVQEGAAGGSISATGFYTAPAKEGTYHVIATSQADSSLSATVNVDVMPVAVYLTPGSLGRLEQGATLVFTATVTGTVNRGVTWSVQEGAAGGTITSGGVYTAPAASGTFHVLATSQADSAKFGIASLSVPQLSVSVSPSLVGIMPGGTKTYSAWVEGAVNKGVIWSIEEGAAGGVITADGIYTAPSSLGTYHVVATSVFDPAQTAIASAVVVDKGFTPVGDLSIIRHHHTATLLSNGEVLIAGGISGDCNQNGCNSQGVASAEIFNPVTNQFRATGSMSTPRSNHSATLLSDGKVLVVGGDDWASGGSALSTAELYDPATGTFSAVGSLNDGRTSHTATLLPDGRVFVAGGWGAGDVLFTTEVYDPATARFTRTPGMVERRTLHTASLLNSGKVLLVAGDSDWCTVLASGELFDPASGTFTTTGLLSGVRDMHTATRLGDGRVLVAGGEWTLDCWNDTGGTYASAQIFDPVSATFGPDLTMTIERVAHTATLLPDGKVLLVGGWGSAGDTAELFDPSSSSFSVTGGPAKARTGHTATLLKDGRVLIVGGWLEKSAEVYP